MLKMILNEKICCCHVTLYVVSSLAMLEHLFSKLCSFNPLVEICNLLFVTESIFHVKHTNANGHVSSFIFSWDPLRILKLSEKYIHRG